MKGIGLLLPALVPSWRFFDGVTASPRVEYALLPAPDALAGPWREFRPRPPVLIFGAMLRRLLWNGDWNETLFLVSLAERLLNAASPETADHSQREMLLRVARGLHRGRLCDGGDWLQIRVMLVQRMGDHIASDIAFLSAPCPMATLITA